MSMTQWLAHRVDNGHELMFWLRFYDKLERLMR